MNETVLYGKRTGCEDWQEELLLTNATPELIEKVKVLAAKDGFVSFRVAVIDLSTPPDFTNSMNIKRKNGGKAGPAERRWMILPYNPAYPDFNEVHREDDWCKKAGCLPVCDPQVVAGKAAKNYHADILTKRISEQTTPAEREGAEQNKAEKVNCLWNDYRTGDRDDMLYEALSAAYDAGAGVKDFFQSPRKAMRDTQTIIPYWFLMRAAGHLTREGHVYNGTCPKCHAREILMLAAMQCEQEEQ